MCPVSCRAVFQSACTMPPSERFHKGKDAARAVAYVFGVNLLVVPWPHGPRLTCFAQQLVWLLVHAHNRPCRVVWPFIDIKHVFHVRYEICICLRRQAPVVRAVGVQPVFFSALRMASRLTGVSSRTFMWPSSSIIVHRARPSGAGPHAEAIIMASALPSTLRRA